MIDPKEMGVRESTQHLREQYLRLRSRSRKLLLAVGLICVPLWFVLLIRQIITHSSPWLFVLSGAEALGFFLLFWGAYPYFQKLAKARFRIGLVEVEIDLDDIESCERFIDTLEKVERDELGNSKT